MRRSRAVLLRQKPMIARGIELPGKAYPLVDIHFSFVERDDRANDVLIMFEPRSMEKPVNPKPPARTAHQPGLGKNKSRRR